MAYHAVNCLISTVDRIIFPCGVSFLNPECQSLVCSIYTALSKLLDALKENDEKRRNLICASERVMSLDAELREAASNLEDSIEPLVYAQILSQSESDPIPPVFSIDLREIHDQIKCFLSMVERMKDAYREEDDAVVSPPIYFDGGETSKVVGFTDLLHLIKFCLVVYPDKRDLLVCGMAGIGKTTAVKKVLEDPQVKETFERRIFVPVGLEPQVNLEFQFKRILKAILAQVKPDSDGEVEKLDETFWESLNNEKTLIVLDDVWTKEIFIQLRKILPSKPNGCRILVTTRIEGSGNVDYFLSIFVPFMNKEESWDLLSWRVFGEDTYIPEELEKAGKKIAENCEGLPLLIIAVADLLSNAERTTEFWNMIAADKENHIFVGAYDQISEVLMPSYYNLPQNLKTFFLFLCVFPQNHQFRRSRLVKLFSGENSYYLCSDMKNSVTMDLLMLEGDNMVLNHRESNFHGVKVYSLHSGFWYLCKREAAIVKNVQTFNRYADGSVESIEGQRRLAIYKNVLLAIKHIYDSVASVEKARSLLCTGPYHQYQVPISFDCLSLLRVLDALTIRYYEFPVEVLQLILLRYLSLTCNGNLPPSISKLWNLQCLIVHKHLSIKSTLAESYLPVEIWNFKELQYLEIMGRNLPDPPLGASLPKLSTLLDVDAHSCTRDVLQGVPKLKKLRVQIELAPDAAECLSCFDHVSHPPELKSFQCIVKNPKIVAPPPLPIFGSCLIKLMLRGFGYPWKEMNKIAGLPCLKVLKLQCYAFRGSKWEAEKGFGQLEKLVIEGTDLMQWTSSSGTFASLRFLTVENCYKLQKIPHIPTFKEIKLVDCNPAVVPCVMQMKTKDCDVSATTSWES